MTFVSSNPAGLGTGFAKPIVQSLFVASCLLSVVSFYTTQQGMALYLSPWFSILAALGIQISLVMVAWLIGFTRRSRALLIAVYVCTALVSIGFSYVSLYTWFTAKERPALMRRDLYDKLTAAAGQTELVLTEASAKGRNYVLALEEMTAAEKTHGHISRARDTDPYLDRIRESVAKEAQSIGAAYREGSGEGVRYTAFERFAKLTGQKVAEVEGARAAVRQAKLDLRPAMAAEDQLRRFRQAQDAVPWASAEELLQRSNIARPAAPDYAEFVEQSASGQEDLTRAFQEAVTAPNARHVLSLLLAAFIDLVVFLLAFSCGPYFHGDAEQRWLAAGASLDAADQQIFARSLLRKLRPGVRGMPRVDSAELTPGEQQFCLLLVSKGLAVLEEHDGHRWYLLDAATHERLLESVAEPGVAMKAAAV
ncbi:MAG: hypothetical protein U0Q16_27070 [Bryobacteraceae bacterium]